jgi:hypothetical protein
LLLNNLASVDGGKGGGGVTGGVGNGGSVGVTGSVGGAMGGAGTDGGGGVTSGGASAANTMYSIQDTHTWAHEACHVVHYAPRRR